MAEDDIDLSDDDVELTDEELRLSQFLAEQAPGFGRSGQYADLDAEDLLNPSTLCGAFKTYVESLYLSAALSQTPAVEREIVDAMGAIERMASSPHSAIVRWVVVDVLETVDLPGSLQKEFVTRLGPRAKALYDDLI